MFFCERTKCRQVFSSGWICEVILQFCRYYLILIRSLSCQKHEIFFLHMWTCECPELENNFQLSLAESYNFFEQNLDQNQGRIFLFYSFVSSQYSFRWFTFCKMNYFTTRARFISFAQFMIDHDFRLLSAFFEQFLSFSYYEIEHLSQKTCSNLIWANFVLKWT